MDLDARYRSEIARVDAAPGFWTTQPPVGARVGQLAGPRYEPAVRLCA